MPIRAARVTVAAAALVGLVGCLDEPGPPPALGDQEAAIVGGISDANHRYVVGVGGANRAFCSGTVISRRTVLTAGHCIGGVRNIFLGPQLNGGATKIAVVEEVQHPLYRALPNDNATWDLGILRLAADAPVQAAPLLRDTMTNTPRFIGPSLVFVGYGTTSGAGAGFGTRRVATFPLDVIGPAVVGNSYPAPDNLPAELFYYLDAQTMNRNTCAGDSGGPSFFVEHGVEWLAGVTSSGDADCLVDGANQRSDLPYITDFIQPHLDVFDADDPCRADGACDETCDQGGQVGDPDCAAAHCAADGVCAEACTAPRDPDCAATAAGNCGDNGICDPTCASDPDCVRMCAAEGNCIHGCATPDPDCPPGELPPDAGPPTPDGGNGATDDAGGCGCRTGGTGATSSGTAAPLLLLVLGWSVTRWRGRRSCRATRPGPCAGCR